MVIAFHKEHNILRQQNHQVMRNNIEQELQEKLKSKAQKNKLNKIDGNKDYKYLDAIVIFFGTLGPSISYFL